jgi:membrane protein YqaA with SNARE-associated domain
LVLSFALDIKQLEWLSQLNKWLEDFAIQFGYLGIFITSFIGASSIIIPIPYTILIFTLGSILNPFLLGISAGIGSAAGEFLGYFLGYYGRTIVSEKTQRKMNNIVRLFSKYGGFTIFLFALTPLPDDLLFVPLGMMRYDFFKAFIPALLGKTLMSLILAYAGFLSVGAIRNFLGEGGALGTTIISTILLVIIIFAMFKIDWEKIIPIKGKEAEKGDL